VTDGVCEQTIEGQKNIPPRLLFPLQNGRLISSSYHNTGHDQKKGGDSSEHDSTIRVWNLVDGQCELTLAGHVQRVHGLVELRDGRIASASDDYTMRIWNIKG
jgi:WD40 repeat protein